MENSVQFNPSIVTRSPDHLIRPCEHVRWDRQADLFGGLKIDVAGEVASELEPIQPDPEVRFCLPLLLNVDALASARAGRWGGAP
jgi:hypothetical protein